MSTCTPENPLRLGRRTKPTKLHRPAVWENMLGTVYAKSPAGEVRYFDYDWDGAVAFAGVKAEGTDPRTWRSERGVSYGTHGPHHGQMVLWIIPAGTRPRMTKTAARERAANQLRFGYYQVEGLLVQVNCPDCRDRVSADHMAWDTPAKRCALLRDALTEHLLRDCTAPTT
jgi:hypothetical protein